MKRFVALAVLLGACSGTGEATSTSAEPTTTSTTATSSATSTTTPPSPTTADTSLTPDLPDPLEIANEGWGVLTGFTEIEVEESDLDLIEFRLGSFIANAVDGLSYTAIAPQDGGGRIIGMSINPAPFLRGDPSLAEGLAGSLAGPFEDAEAVDLTERQVWRVFLIDTWWYFWSSNTHLYVMVGPETEAESALAAAIAAAPAPYFWQANDCLWFGTGEETATPYAPYGTANLVSCDGPHTHEVFFADGTDYGPNDPHPGEGFATEVERTCGAAYVEYIGVTWPDSKVSAIRYLPDVTEWEEGDRYMACVAELSDPAGGAQPIDGTLRGLGESALIDRQPGDCHVRALNAEPVKCEVPHTAQFVGYLEDPTPAGEPFPGTFALFEAQLPACEALLRDFAAVMDKNGARVSAHVAPTPIMEWEADNRTFRCFGFAVDDEGRRIEVSGSFDGEWEIVRFSEDDVTA